MSIETFVSGFPRVGANREYKWAVEKYWRNEISEEDLYKTIDQVIIEGWQVQKNSLINRQLVGDFSFYDQVLDTITHLGIPLKRFGYISFKEIESYFTAARGGSINGKKEQPLEMTKWFHTNYHYLVPEIDWELSFSPQVERLNTEIKLANSINSEVVPKLIGPATLMTLSKEKDLDNDQESKLISAYKTLFDDLNKLGFKEVMLDEGGVAVGSHFVRESHFNALLKLIDSANIDIRLNGYFGSYSGFLDSLINSGIKTIHLDLCEGNFPTKEIIRIAKSKNVHLGIINGRSIWKSNLIEKYKLLEKIKEKVDSFEIGSSCSLLHVPYSLKQESNIEKDLKAILSFGYEKLDELRLLQDSLEQGSELPELINYSEGLVKANSALNGRLVQEVRDRILSLDEKMFHRDEERQNRLKIQTESMGVPKLPTTTIGSFPQTSETRSLRRKFKSNDINEEEYIEGIKSIIKDTVEIQEELGLDVLVHGEAERNDMVEYFGELLSGFAFTTSGWVQSYGSRCVKPPIIYGDVSRQKKMTVDWSVYAQSLTSKPMKGMLTGPVTILQWSFVRDDISKREVAYQIALALREEVLDLESNGIKIIQIDEPAIREGLPLDPSDKEDYLNWAVESFKLTCSGVNPKTQIHSHMCYSEFDEILDAINALDVDVLSIEASRSGMNLVNSTLSNKYNGAIGPGVYDIHSPLVLDFDDAKDRINQLSQNLKQDYIWINPDCGLKTRGWDEVKESLRNMVKATIEVREGN